MLKGFQNIQTNILRVAATRSAFHPNEQQWAWSGSRVKPEKQLTDVISAKVGTQATEKQEKTKCQSQ